MSPQPYVFPEFASPQLKVVQDYFKYLSALDIDNLGTLMADDFHQKTAPLSLGVPDKTKAQDLAFLEELKVVLNGQHLHVSRAQVFHSY
jgi:ketosteroid isomerase-like protein